MPKYHVERSTVIEASPEKVYEAVVDYGSWTTWSPWLCMEATADVTVSSDASSVGSLYEWKGELVGQGEIEHKSLSPSQRIDDEIRFIKPFKSVSQVAFDIEPSGTGTKITWHMDGSLPWFMFWMKGMMDAYVGMDYARGLKMLKEWLETGQILSKTTVKGVQATEPLKAAGIRASCGLDAIGPIMEEAFTEARQQFEKQGLPLDGECLAIYHKFDMKNQTTEFTCAFAIADDANPTGLEIWSKPQCQALNIEHVGSYNHLGNAWSTAQSYVRYKKLKQSKVGTYEIYRNNPCDTDEADLITDIYLPLR